MIFSRNTLIYCKVWLRSKDKCWDMWSGNIGFSTHDWFLSKLGPGPSPSSGPGWDNLIQIRRRVLMHVVCWRYFLVDDIKDEKILS